MTMQFQNPKSALRPLTSALCLCLLTSALCLPAFAQGTAFTYQGQLKDGGNPAGGIYDLRFTIYDSTNNPGVVIAGPITNAATGVSNGLFTVTLNFGAGMFTGADRWLEIGVRNGGGAFTVLSPRQQLTSTPYAIHAGDASTATSVSGSVSAAQLTGTIAPANIAAGTISSTMLASGAVTTDALAAGAVTASKVATVSNWFSALTVTNPFPATDAQFGSVVVPIGSDRLLIATPLAIAGGVKAGAAYLFTVNGTLLNAITNPTPAMNDLFADSVAFLGADRVLIGARQDDIGAIDAGTAYVFRTNGLLLTVITNPSPTISDWFADAVAVVGSDCLAIGAPFEDVGAAVNCGLVYLFRTNGTLLTTITNPTPSQDSFGDALAAVGSDRLLVGAKFDSVGVIESGSAYLFHTNGTLLTTFTNPTPSANDWFGYAVAAVGNDKVLIGAYQDNTGASITGAAYLFSTNGTLLTTFTNPTPVLSEHFGASVAGVGSDRVLIGARGENSGVQAAGEAYLFSTNGTLLETFANPTPEFLDLFGESVAPMENGQIVIGAASDNLGVSGAGVVYLFTQESYAPGLRSEGVRVGGVTTESLADGSVTATKIGGVDASQLTTGTVPDARLAANVARTNQVWLLGGNAGTTPGAQFLGTTDNQPLEFKVNGQRTLRIETNRFLISAPNSVGINITNPLHLLHVGTTLGTNALNASPNVIAIESAVENGRATFLALAGIGGLDTTNRVEVQIEAVENTRRGIIGTTTEHPVHFRVGNSDVMVAATNRFIGVNEADPQARLHVTGSGSAAAQLHLEQTVNNDFSRLRFSSGSKPHWTIAIGGPENVMNFFNPTNGNVMSLTTNGNLTTSGTVNGVSDRAAKDHFKPVNSREILERVAALPLARWEYKTDPGVTHLGPVAQDFKAAFGLGADDKHIATVDADGVALAAIQGLNQKVEAGGQKSEARVQKLEAENAELKRRLDALEKIILNQSSNSN